MRKSAPMPSRRQSPLLPQPSRAKSLPLQISNMPHNHLVKFSNSAMEFFNEQDSKTTLDKELIENYLQVMSKVSATNKILRATLPFTPISSWKNITIINLQYLEINEAILGVLNMTISDQITTIVLRNVSFDTGDTVDKFIKFLSKNKDVKFVILDTCYIIDDTSINKLLGCLHGFKKLALLEISNFNFKTKKHLYTLNYGLINSRSLQFLLFYNNAISEADYKWMFENQDETNGKYIKQNKGGIWWMYNRTDYDTTIMFRFDTRGNYDYNTTSNEPIMLTDYNSKLKYQIKPILKYYNVNSAILSRSSHQSSSPLSSRRKSSPLPSTPPLNLSNMHEDLRLNIFNSLIVSAKPDKKLITTLDNKLIIDYLEGLSKVSRINKSFNALLHSTTSIPLWDNISIIKLAHIKINDAILGVILNMINTKNITTILLDNVSFDTDVIRDKFLKFLSRNKNVTKLKFSSKIEAQQFLKILRTFTKLIWLEISWCELNDTFPLFVKALINLKNLKYLTFTHNTVDAAFYNRLFTQNAGNIVTINNIPYEIHISYDFEKSWLMLIRNTHDDTLFQNIQINILHNYIITQTGEFTNYKNDFNTTTQLPQ